jgi:hypothetical protein
MAFIIDRRMGDGHSSRGGQPMGGQRAPEPASPYPNPENDSMKHVDYLYFNIYSYFYRISQARQTFNPRIQTMYLFSLGSGGWLLLLEALYLHLIKHTRSASHAESTIFSASVYMLTTLFFNYIFIVKDRDLKIFGKYEEQSNKNPKRKWHFVVSVIVLILPYLTLAALALVFPRRG